MADAVVAAPDALADHRRSAGQLATTLQQEKRARKLAEEDAQRLYNRIRQLQKEDERAARRIAQTRQKVARIEAVRADVEQRAQVKLVWCSEQQQHLELQRQENARLKELHVKARQDVEARLLAEKLQVAAETKEERAELAAELQLLKLERQAAVQAKKEAVRRQQEEGGNKVQQYKAAQTARAQEEYERRLQEEIDQKQQKLNEIQQLAALEAALIQQLQRRRQEQLEASQRLETTLAAGKAIRTSQCSPTLRARSPHSPTAKHQRQHQHQHHQQQQQHGGGLPKCSSSTSLPSSSSSARFINPSDEDVARAFAAYDADATGVIAVHQLPGLCRDLGNTLTAAQYQEAVRQLDSEKGGTVSFGRFLLWWRQ